MLLDDIKNVCREAASSALAMPIDQVSIEFPEKFGDVAMNCFHLAKAVRQAPPTIAQKVAAALAGRPGILEAVATSGYINITLDRRALFEDVIGKSVGVGDRYGHAARRSPPRRILVEYSSPNTNKPQHLGHVRNDVLGESLSRILDASGIDVVRANLVNDRGIHICKSMLAYQRLGEGRTPASTGIKGDHFVGDFYVLYNKHFEAEMAAYKSAHPEAAGMDKEEFFKISEWGQSAQRLLVRWEQGDEEVRKLWAMMNGWVMEGFEKTYGDLGIRFDKIYLESKTYVLGKEIIQRGLEKGIFQRRADGAIEIDLTAEKLDRKVVLRSDGTSVYITQDIGTTVMKAEENDIHGQVFVVGDEQIHHFRVLFAILKRLGYAWSDGLVHLAYGMVNLPEGKMKSREGTVVDADDLIEEVTQLAREEIGRRDAEVTGTDLDERARKIGLAALKFMILAVTPTTTMVYDPKASVNFEGDTGPYVLYAYARIRRMLEDSGHSSAAPAADLALLVDPSEVRLGLMLLQFPGVILKAGADSNPSNIARWLLDAAHAYHSHNRAVPILKAEDPKLRAARLALSFATASALRSGLMLLGIEPVDRM